MRIGLTALALATIVALPLGNVDAKVRSGDRAGKLVGVTDGAGNKVTFKAHKKKVIVVTFGASWCAPCKAELPALEKLAEKYADKQVIFIAINIDKEKKKGAKFMRDAGLKRVVAAFDAKKTTVDSFDPPSMPSTFVIRKGIVRHVHKGYRKGDDKKLDKVIAKEVSKL